MAEIEQKNADVPKRIVSVNDLTIDLAERTAEIRGVPVQLKPREYDILELLARKKGLTVTKRMFLDDLYHGVNEPAMKVIDVFVCELKKKLAKASESESEPDGENYIDVVWGRGYIFGGSVQVAQRPATDGAREKRPSFVHGPDGRPLTLSDLPLPGTKRWVIRCKAEVIAAVRGGLLTVEEACALYAMDPLELISWQCSIDAHGLAGLRTTRIQQYRGIFH